MAYTDKFGVEYSDDKKTLIRCPKDFEGEYVIPEGVTTIGEEAFYNSIYLTSVIFPDSLTAIRDNAFESCTRLTSISIGNKVSHIGECSFGWATITAIWTSNLKEIHFRGTLADWCDKTWTPNQIACNYKYDLFIQETKVADLVIPDSVTCIKEKAFEGCASLTSIAIGDNVTSIEKDAFNHCGNVSSIFISNSVSSIGENAFYYYKGIQSLTLPAKFINPDNYTEPKYGEGDWSALIGGRRLPAQLILTGNLQHLDFSKCQWYSRSANSQPCSVFCATQIESITLPNESIEHSEVKFYINNYIEDVDVIGVDKWTDTNLIFRAPKLSKVMPHQNVVELTLNPRSSFFPHYRGDNRWSRPIDLAINSVTYLYPIEMACYEDNYQGTRLLLCGLQINDAHMEYLKKTESFPYIDVWEPYETVCELLKKGGWAMQSL